MVTFDFFEFYNSSLDHLTNVKLDSIIDGMGGVYRYKSLDHQIDADYVMVTIITDLDKIEAQGIKHVHERQN